MEAAERLERDATEPLPWAAICLQYPDQYVCLIDVENGSDGAIRSGRVVGHAPSMRQLLAEITKFDVPQRASVIVQTAGRALGSPRIEMTDEIRNIVRPQR